MVGVLILGILEALARLLQEKRPPPQGKASAAVSALVVGVKDPDGEPRWSYF